MKLPAGLENKGVEIYSFENKLKAIYNGNIIEFEQLPNEIKEVFAVQCFASTKAIKAMENVGITSIIAKVHQFVFCNFGGFNDEPDMDENGAMNMEYWDCGKRNICPFKGAVCGAFECENGVITNREIEVIRLLQKGLKNKEIAAVLKISINTIINHIANINHKTNTGTRIEIINWASKHNLI